MTLRKTSSKVFILGLFSTATIILLNASLTRAAATHLVISQVETNTSSDDEFVELYNPTNSSVDLTSWKLSRKNSSGTEANLVASLSGTIASKGYFLIGSADYTGSVTKDITYSNNSSDLTNNHTVLLYDQGSALVDKVGMGTALDFEASAAANPAALQSIQRKVDDTFGHGLDTDNNASDFEVLDTASPRNSLVVVSTPTITPTSSPTTTPSSTPSASPTATATPTPTASPTQSPTSSPTATPTSNPTTTPTATPTSTPTSGQVIGVFNFPNFRMECRIKYISFSNGFFFGLFPSFVCLRV